MNVKIIEIDKQRWLELSELLPKALIINADGTDEEFLLSENINNIDAYIAVTGIDEENVLSSLLTKQNGVKKVITKISRTNYANLVSEAAVMIPSLLVDSFLKQVQDLQLLDQVYLRMLKVYLEVVIMFVGGCAGSTAGGIKNIRILLLFKIMRRIIAYCSNLLEKIKL